jgi:peroxiredoxin Q/BCP
MNEQLAIDQAVADFSAVATGNQTIRLADLRGKNVVLYFYPKDNTPGCTLEGQQFRDHYKAFCDLDAVILGVSRDGLRTHENFRTKQGFPFHLLADKEATLCQRFAVLKPKKMYGKEVVGVERSTFLIDKNGVLRRVWRNVKADGHAAEVLAALQEINP